MKNLITEKTATEVFQARGGRRGAQGGGEVNDGSISGGTRPVNLDSAK
jgi:hypothetical protein